MAGKEGHVPTLSMLESLDPYSKYSRLQKGLRFSIFGSALFFWSHFDLINQQKMIFVISHRHVRMMFI
jgi:hypothetical protein